MRFSGMDVAALKPSLDVGNSIMSLIAAVPAGAVSYGQVAASEASQERATGDCNA